MPKTIIKFLALTLFCFPLIAVGATNENKLLCATGLFKAEVSPMPNPKSIKLISPALSLALPINNKPLIEQNQYVTSTTYRYTAPDKTEVLVKIVNDNTCTITFNLNGVNVFQSGKVIKE